MTKQQTICCTEKDVENWPELLCNINGHTWFYGYCAECGFKDEEWFDNEDYV